MSTHPDGEVSHKMMVEKIECKHSFTIREGYPREEYWRCSKCGMVDTGLLQFEKVRK